MNTVTVTVKVELPDEEAEAFAQFLKRARLDSFRALAASDDEAYDMQAAGVKLQKAFAEAGYAPR